MKKNNNKKLVPFTYTLTIPKPSVLKREKKRKTNGSNGKTVDKQLRNVSKRHVCPTVTAVLGPLFNRGTASGRFVRICYGPFFTRNVYTRSVTTAATVATGGRGR